MKEADLRGEEDVVVVTLQVEVSLESGNTSIADVGAL